MRQEVKDAFDHLNSTSYLLRLNLERLGFDFHSITLLNDTIWHVVYNESIVGTVTFREADNMTFCNIRLYKSVKQKLDNLEDFVMSDYFEYDEEHKPVRFNFEKFDTYFDKIKKLFEVKASETAETALTSSYNDSINRLAEYCDEFDQQFSKNVLVYDIRNVLSENERLHSRLEHLQENILNCLCKIKV